jgi:hypothetical protein
MACSTWSKLTIYPGSSEPADGNTWRMLEFHQASFTHVNEAGGHSFSLGGGASALFQLENGFTASNGSAVQQGQLFGRQADVVGVTTNGIGDGVPGTSSNNMGIAFDIRTRF